MEDEDDLMELTGSQAVGLGLFVIAACVITLYIFLALSSSLLGWIILIVMAVLGFVIFIILNRRYRLVPSLRETKPD